MRTKRTFGCVEGIVKRQGYAILLKEEQHHFEFKGRRFFRICLQGADAAKDRLHTQPKIGCMQCVVKRAEAGNENKVLRDGMLFFGVPYTG